MRFISDRNLTAKIEERQKELAAKEEGNRPAEKDKGGGKSD